MCKNKYFFKGLLEFDSHNVETMEIKYSKMNKLKKKAFVLFCVILLIGVLNMTSVNILPLLSSFPELFNMNDGVHKIGNYYEPPNIQEIVLTPVYDKLRGKDFKQSPCYFSHSSRVICHKQNHSFVFGNQEKIAKEEADCPIIKEMKVMV